MRSVIFKLYRRYHRINVTSVFISSMAIIFIFGFAKNIYKKKLRPIKDASLPSISDVSPDHIKKCKNGIIHTSLCPLYDSFAFPAMILFTSDFEGMDASLIGRNFFSSKYFFANPKIKIIRIIEINMLVPLVFLKKVHICFFEFFSESLLQYSES